jgi:hypothetical protein
MAVLVATCCIVVKSNSFIHIISNGDRVASLGVRAEKILGKGAELVD